MAIILLGTCHSRNTDFLSDATALSNFVANRYFSPELTLNEINRYLVPFEEIRLFLKPYKRCKNDFSEQKRMYEMFVYI